jgi:hypothetical protein
MRNLTTTALLLLPVSILLASALSAQGVTTAAIYGRVIATDSAGIEEALVTVTDASNGERWQVATRGHGQYLLEYLSLGGPYTVEARAIGFAPVRLTGVMLSLGERRGINLALTPAVVELAELTATAAVDPLINAGRTGPAQTISDSLISRLPVGKRDFSQLVFLSPQAVLGPGGGVSIAGQSDRLNGVQIDGATNLDLTGFAGGGAGLGTPAASSGVRTLSVEALRELQILTAPFDVRYGTFAGGLVNAVTRSGSNRRQGSLSAYFEDEALTGKDLTGSRAQDYSTQELALTLSGPIIRDRASFFLDLGLQRDLTPQFYPGIGSDTVGGADSVGIGIRYASAQRFRQILRDSFNLDAGDFRAEPTRRPSGNLFAKITLQPRVNQRLEFSHNYAHGNPVEPPLWREPDVQYSLTSNASRSPGTVNATRLAWTMTPGSAVSNELNLAYLRVRERCEVTGHFPEVAVTADASVLVAGDPPLCSVNFSNQDVWELTDNLSWFRGSHQFTLGTHDELIRTRRNTELQPLGHWGFDSLGSLAARLPSEYFRSINNPLRPSGPLADLGVNQIGVYAQDRWSVSPRLTLTAGVRLDVPYFTSAPVRNPLLGTELGIDNSRPPTGNPSWSPRLGASYDLGGLGFLRGGVGLFTGRPAYHWLSTVYGSTGLDAADLYCAGPDVPAFTLDPANQPSTCGTGPSSAIPTVNYFNPSFRFPRSLRLALGTDFRLPQGIIGTLDFLYVRSVDQLYLEDVNLIQTGVASGEGNRALYGTFDPATGDPTPNRRSAAFGPVIELRNSSGDRSYVATAQLQKRFTNGAELGLAYTYSNSKDRMSTAHDLASVNSGRQNILDGTVANRRLASSLYDTPHKISIVAAVDLPLRFRFSLFYNGSSGSPYTFRVFGDANADGASAFGGPTYNDPVYVPRDQVDITLANPAQWDSLNSYVEGHSCLRSQRGHLLRRNSCRNPWVTLMNARLSKVFPTAHGQSMELIIDLFNVPNFLDRDWGVRSGADLGFPPAILVLVGYDQANQRGMYRFEAQDTKVRDNDATRWRLQFGARYTF